MAEEITAVAPARTANEFAGQAAVSGGNYFANTGEQLLVIEHTNAEGADITLTVVTQVEIDGEVVAGKEIPITKGKRYLIGFFPTAWYNDGDGYVQLTYTSHTDVKVGVITLT